MTLPYEVSVGKRKVFYAPTSPKMLKSSDFHDPPLKPSIALDILLTVHLI